MSQDDKNFYDKTIIPECNEIIEPVLNDQVFEALGLHLDFQPETLDAFQEDEAQRAGALQQLTGSGIPLLMAMDILGYELTDEQRTELEQLAVEKEERREAMVEQLQNPPERPETGEREEVAESSEETPAKADLDKWRRKALKSLEKGKSAGVPFESLYIDPGEHARICAALAACQTADEVRAAFGGNGYHEDAAMVLEGIRLAVQALKVTNEV